MCRTEGMISKEIGKVAEGIYVCTGRRKLCLGRKEESHEEKNAGHKAGKKECLGKKDGRTAKKGKKERIFKKEERKGGK